MLSMEIRQVVLDGKICFVHFFLIDLFIFPNIGQGNWHLSLEVAWGSRNLSPHLYKVSRNNKPKNGINTSLVLQR